MPHKSVGTYAFLVALLIGSTAVKAEKTDVQVFNLPLGGKLKPSPKDCTVENITTNNNKALCWISKPFTAKDGSKLGSVLLPSPDSLPEWAAYAGFRASVSRDGRLTEIIVKVEDGAKKMEIASSIGKRFGLPVSTTLPRTDFAKAEWSGEGIGVFQTCTARTCEVRFLSPEALRELSQRQETAERVKAARPASP